MEPRWRWLLTFTEKPLPSILNVDEPLRLSVQALRARFAEILQSEGFAYDVVSSATLLSALRRSGPIRQQLSLQKRARDFERRPRILQRP